jgi:enoyl-CoA hydratase
MDDVLSVTSEAGVATVTLNRPSARNALSGELIGRLAETLGSVEGDPEVRAVVLTGTDPAFCAGLDLNEVRTEGLDAGLLADATRNPWSVLRRMDTPVIGAINGACVTGGLELALHCSFLVASEKARFADTHGRVGLHPGGGITALLPQAIGVRRAKQMTFTGQFIDAAEALAYGLVNEVVAHEDLLRSARRIAGQIAAADSRTINAINRTYRDVAETTLGEGQDLELRRCLAWKPSPAE